MARVRGEPGSGLRVLALMALVVVVAVGAWAYLELTRLDRFLGEARAYSYEPEVWNFLAENADEPAVRELFVERLHEVAAQDHGDSFRTVVVGALGQAFNAHPPKADLKLLRAAARVRLRYDDAALLTWPRLAKDDPLIAAALYDIFTEMAGDAEAWKAGLEPSLAALQGELRARGLADGAQYVRHMIALAMAHDAAGPRDYIATMDRDAALRQGLIDHFTLAFDNDEAAGKASKETLRQLALLRAARPDGSDTLLTILTLCAAWSQPVADACASEARDLGPPAVPRIVALGEAGGAAGLRQLSQRFARELKDPVKAVAAILVRLDLDLAQLDWPRKWIERPLGAPISMTPPAWKTPAQAAMQRLEMLGEDASAPMFEQLGAVATPAKRRLNRVRVLTAALGARDAGGLARVVEQRIQSLETRTRAIAKSARENKRTSDADARAFLADREIVVHGLLALRQAGSGQDKDVNFALFRALGSLTPAFSQFALKTLRDRLDGATFANTLFAFVARKDRYTVSEVEIYKSTLISYKDAADAITSNMRGLLSDKRGVPEAVFWIYKVLGLSALAEIGQPDAVAVLRDYVRDGGHYFHITTRTEDGRTVDVKREKRLFSQLASEAIKRIESR